MSDLVGNPEDRFSRHKAQIEDRIMETPINFMSVEIFLVQSFCQFCNDIVSSPEPKAHR